MIFPGIVFGALLGGELFGSKPITYYVNFGWILTGIGFAIYVLWLIISYVKYSSQKPIWDQAQRVWNRLYFCFRDNKIYDPETGLTLDVENIHNYIFKARM